MNEDNGSNSILNIKKIKKEPNKLNEKQMFYVCARLRMFMHVCVFRQPKAWRQVCVGILKVLEIVIYAFISPHLDF